MEKTTAEPMLYFMVLPGVLYFLIFKYWPMYGIFIAFKDYQPFLGFLYENECLKKAQKDTPLLKQEC
ncbi:hypothetical protein BK127_36995 [Paenibacillus sp. FSL H7-0331]|nr:hypothetical protein BK127_36995 [Paenibacillus sp. FSL H7-0331]